jgi:hypothetical protein
MATSHHQIRQAQDGQHQDRSVIAGIREMQIENERQLEFAREIDRAMAQSLQPAPANNQAEEPTVVVEHDLLNFAEFGE